MWRIDFLKKIDLYRDIVVLLDKNDLFMCVYDNYIEFFYCLVKKFGKLFYDVFK